MSAGSQWLLAPNNTSAKEAFLGWYILAPSSSFSSLGLDLLKYKCRGLSKYFLGVSALTLCHSLIGSHHSCGESCLSQPWRLRCIEGKDVASVNASSLKYFPLPSSASEDCTDTHNLENTQPSCIALGPLLIHGDRMEGPIRWLKKIFCLLILQYVFCSEECLIIVGLTVPV